MYQPEKAVNLGYLSVHRLSRVEEGGRCIDVTGKQRVLADRNTPQAAMNNNNPKHNCCLEDVLYCPDAAHLTIYGPGPGHHRLHRSGLRPSKIANPQQPLPATPAANVFPTLSPRIAVCSVQSSHEHASTTCSSAPDNKLGAAVMHQLSYTIHTECAAKPECAPSQ